MSLFCYQAALAADGLTDSEEGAIKRVLEILVGGNLVQLTVNTAYFNISATGHLCRNTPFSVSLRSTF